MNKHTPGPWTSDRMLIPPRAKDRRCGFVVNGPDAGNGPLPVRICDLRCSPELPFGAAQATANLIAAAPDLLEALAGLLANSPAPKGIRKDFSYVLYREAANKALAKARGEA